MRTTPLLTNVIHDALATVFCFALSRQRAHEVLNTKFLGEWKYLRKVVLDRSEQQATKAALELALFLRILDDNEAYTKRQWKEIDCGFLVGPNDTVSDLNPRQAANKIIHAQSHTWQDTSGADADIGPLLVCHGRPGENWVRADIEIFALSAVCGMLIS